jgi:hypothetical protein
MENNYKTFLYFFLENKAIGYQNGVLKKSKFIVFYLEKPK